LLLLTVACGVSWYFGRPYLLVYQAKSLLVTDPKRAAELLEDAVASAGDRFPDAQVLWCRALLRSGRWQEALGCFSQIKNPELTDGAALLDLAGDARADNLTLLAEMSLGAISPSNTHRPEALEHLIDIRKQKGDLNGILSLASELATLQPEDASPWQSMAYAHEQMMLLPVAAKDYREYLAREQIPRERVSGLRSIIRILIHLGEKEDARERQDELAHLTVCHSPNAVDQLNEGRLRRLEGDIDGAWNQATAIIQDDKNSFLAIELRGTLSMDRVDYVAAESDFRTVINHEPWNKQAHYKLALTFARLGREKEAEVHFKENRRLLEFSNRILELQNKLVLTPDEKSELINALEQTGLKTIADQMRQRID